MNLLKNKLLTIVLVLCLAFTIFIGITANKRENKGVFQGVISSTITPIQRYIYLAGQRIGNIFYYVDSIRIAHRENVELKSQVKDLQGRLVEYDAFKRQNEDLNKLLGYKDNSKFQKLIPANVIGKTGENWFDILLLDVGESDGVMKDQYVVTSEGLVGKVIETSANTSKVMTILDERINIPATLSSNGEDGIVSGVRSSSLERSSKMFYLSVESKAKEGDLVVTSNIIKDESVYIPSGIIIGSVTKLVDEKPNLEKAVEIKPIVDFSKLEKVLIITR